MQSTSLKRDDEEKNLIADVVAYQQMNVWNFFSDKFDICQNSYKLHIADSWWMKYLHIICRQVTVYRELAKYTFHLSQYSFFYAFTIFNIQILELWTMKLGYKKFAFRFYLINLNVVFGISWNIPSDRI